VNRPDATDDTAAPSSPSTGDVAVVLSGAGARGAFQAGALAEIVPQLAAQGLRPRIWLGTSAGSINAALWGAVAHLDADEAAHRVVGLWEGIDDDDVYRPLLPVSAPRVALEYAGGALLGLGPGTTSLLDTAPLRRTLVERLPLAQLAANVTAGAVGAVGVVATRMPDSAAAAGARSVLFLDEHEPGTYAGEPGRALDVARGPVQAAHVLASSAIPVAFPAVRVDAPSGAAGWYLDGGVRLNTPLNPAVDLGATRIVVVSATPTTCAPAPDPHPHPASPDIADAAAQVLDAVTGDRTTEDIAALRRTNRLVDQARGAAGDGRLADTSGRPYRAIPLLVVAPRPAVLGEVADEVFRRRTSGLRRLRELDNWLLGRVIRGAGDGAGRRELLSYLFFDEEYFRAGVGVGRAAAREALAGDWQL
jgi:NTE family protein